MPGAPQSNYRRELKQTQGSPNSPKLGGYEDEGGNVLAVQGDRDAPWGKNPPFPSGLSGYVTQSLALGVLEGPGIDVRDHNVFTLYGEYVPEEPGASLEYILLAQGQGELDDPSAVPLWFPLTMVDQAIVKAGGVFTREVGTASFKTPVGVMFPIAQAFDVSPFTGVRVVFSENDVIADPGSVRTFFNLSL